MADETGFMTNSKGHRVPLHLVKPEDRLEDEVVRKIHSYAEELMSRIARFREHTYDDLAALEELLAGEYGVKLRGRREGGRGNVTFKTFDGMKKAGISIQDYMEYGSQLQTARNLFYEYIEEVSGAAPDELRTLLEFAFETDKPGKVRNDMLYAIRRLNITHPKFVKAVEAIKDAQRVAVTREFVQILSREAPDAPYRTLPINLANAFIVGADPAKDEEGAA